MKKENIIITVLAVLLTASCATQRDYAVDKRPAAETRETITDQRMAIYKDDHSATRRNADRIFNGWLDSKHLRGHVVSKRLVSVKPDRDGCQLHYEFRLMDGTRRRVNLVVLNFSQEYKKQKRARLNNTYVNGRMYQLRQ